MANKHHVGVFVRIKPTDRFASDIIELLPNSSSLNIHTRKDKHRGHINNQILDWHFVTDGVLYNASQEEVYEKCASRLVTLTLDGYNNTLFAYGQTGSGKTYTMTGTTGNFQHRGIIPRAISQLYRDIEDRLEYDITVRISYLEIYKESMFDLLASLDGSEEQRDLTITEDDQGMTCVKGLACHIARTEEEALNFLFEGETNRTISRHLLNRSSSRSHCIFTIYCDSHSKTQSDTRYTTSKFNFVDLAGSERLAKTLSEGKTQEEAMYINKALTFLEQTVIALEDKSRTHVPYRQSKLTHLLKDSLGGKCNTVMVGNIWGEESQFEETLSTLRFAARVMNIPSQPAVNSYHNPILLCRQYEKEIAILRKELAMYDTLTNRNQVNYEPLSDMQIKDIQQQVRRYVDNDIPEIDVINNRQVKEVFAQFKVLVNNLEVEIETKLPEKLAGVKITESANKSNEKNSSVAPKANLVGENDCTSFSVGKAVNVKAAAPSAIATARKRNRKRRESTFQGDSNLNRPISESSQKTISNIISTQLENLAERESVSPKPCDRPYSPPTKENAFDIFKSEQGRELNQLFQQNKEVLNNKKREGKELSAGINKTKREIDDAKSKLDSIHVERENDDSNGELFLDEEEFELIRKLKSLKNIYRVNYEYLRNLRSDFVYCERMVKLSRQKLLSEFEVWYNDSFGVSISDVCEKPEINDPLTRSSPNDEGEKLENVQKELLMTFPESVAFYNARINTDRRKLFNRSGKKKSLLPAIKDKMSNVILSN